MSEQPSPEEAGPASSSGPADRLELQGRVVLVTGAGRGIGRALAIGLARHGVHVCLAARTKAEIVAAARVITQAGGIASTVVADVTCPDDVERMVATAIANHGQVDGLVNNAGVMRSGSVADASAADIDAVVNTNVRSVVLPTRAIASHFQQRAAGKIVNIASAYGERPVRGTGLYGASKAASIHLTRVCALEFAADGIQVNAVAPGYVDTALTAQALAHDDLRQRIVRRIPSGHIAAPEELVAPVAFLLSAGSDNITGAVLTADGGLSL